MANKVYHFPLIGGEDKVSSDMDIPNGVARTLYNYEQNFDTGYSRIGGYRKLVNDTTPGVGPVRGLVVYDDVIYMFRNKTVSEGGIWKATVATYDDSTSPPTIPDNGAWVAIDPAEIQDKNGAPILLEPDGYYEFVTHNFKATSRDYGDYQGDWEADTQYYPNDIMQDAGNVLGNGATAKYITHQAHESDPTDLTVDTDLWRHMVWETEPNTGEAHDISGSSGKLYGVDGKNPSFEFDGTTLTQIDSTYNNDTPQHIEANGNRLILGFRAGEIAISELGNPLGFDPVFGAGSIGVTDYLTGLLAGPDNVLYIFAKNKIYLLHGMGGPLDQTELKKHSKAVGSYPFSEQILGDHTLFWDKWGLTELAATDTFGDVVTNSLSKKIQPLLKGLQPVHSVVLKDRAQYRGYFSSLAGTATTTTCIIVTLIEDSNLGFTHAVYPFELSSAASGEVDNIDFSLAGTVDGEVYHMDTGNSFDGDSYLSYITMPFHHMGSPYITKKWRKVRMNITAPSATTFQGQVDFTYGAAGQPSDALASDIAGTGIVWGEGTWGSFIWSGDRYSRIEGYINGHGENVSIVLQTDSATEKPHTLKDISYIYENLRIEH